MRGTGITCDEARRLIALGEPGADTHVRSCEACRLEAGRLDPILQALRTGAAVEVPDSLDRAVREALAEPARTVVLNMPLAITLSFVASLAILSAVALTLANTLPAGLAVIQGALLLILYVAISSVAALPLFIRRRSLVETQRWI